MGSRQGLETTQYIRRALRVSELYQPGTLTINILPAYLHAFPGEMLIVDAPVLGERSWFWKFFRHPIHRIIVLVLLFGICLILVVAILAR